jgi:hypothetical protein
MDALPDDLPQNTEAFTGLTCPDCSGNIIVCSRHGHAYFVCRVGHFYSISEFVVATEDVVERAMWTAVLAYEQLADLLTGLARLGLAGAFEDEARAARVGAALGHARHLREILDRDGPLHPVAAYSVDDQ